MRHGDKAEVNSCSPSFPSLKMSGLEIFGAVASVIATIHLATRAIDNLRGFLHGYQNASAGLEQAAGGMSDFEIRLETWKLFWGITATITESTIKKFWGENGGGLIRKQLVRINEDCERFTQILVALVNNEEVKEPGIESQAQTAQTVNTSSKVRIISV